MTVMAMMAKFMLGVTAGLTMVFCVEAAQAQMRMAEPVLSPAQVRSRILDTCMVARSREVSQMTPIYSGCSCYAAGLAKIMEPTDVVAYARTGQVPNRLTPPAQQIYNQCVK
jgi:hypothetical protein